LKKNIRYNKDLIEKEARLSIEQKSITNELGKFIYQRCIEISGSAFFTNGDNELKQSLIDEAVMRVCEKFLHYYKEGGSAANLIITMIYSTMTNKIVGLRWKDKYGQRIKGKVTCIENGERLTRLIKYVKDDNISKKL
jgi:hypothetical protein